MTEEKQKRRAIAQRTAQLANAEIDSRLAQAIRDRAKAMAQVSKLVHWQDRLARLEQEINSLIGFQQRLSGKVPSNRFVEYNDPSAITSYSSPILPISEPRAFGHLSPIPDGVTSIPAGKGPKPTTQNVADVVGGEGGFS